MLSRRRLDVTQDVACLGMEIGHGLPCPLAGRDERQRELGMRGDQPDQFAADVPAGTDQSYAPGHDWSPARASLNCRCRFTIGHSLPMIENTTRVAIRAVGHQHVIAQDAVLFGAQSRDGVPRGMVEPAGAELHRAATQDLERMREQQQLGLGIQRGPLHPLRVPGPADLDAAVIGIDVAVSGTADNGSVGIEHRPGHRGAGLAKSERLFDIGANGIRRRHRGVPQARQVAVGRRRAQTVHVGLRQGLQPDMPALQQDGLDPADGRIGDHGHRHGLFSVAGRAWQWSTAKRISSKDSSPYQKTFHGSAFTQPSDSSK